MKKASRGSHYELIKDSLSRICHNDVEIIFQTMPPFTWHFGGQRYQNLFIDPDEIVEFCLQTNMRICLDISHSKLACNHFKWSFRNFSAKYCHTLHICIADASG